MTQSYSVAEVGFSAWMMSFCVEGEKLDSNIHGAIIAAVVAAMVSTTVALIDIENCCHCSPKVPRPGSLLLPIVPRNAKTFFGKFTLVCHC